MEWKNFHTPQQSNFEDCGSFATYCILNQLKQHSDFKELDQYKAFDETDVSQFRMGILQFIYYLSGDDRYSIESANCLICLLPVDLSHSIIGYCETSRKTGVYHERCLSASTQCLCCKTKTQFIISTSTSSTMVTKWLSILP